MYVFGYIIAIRGFRCVFFPGRPGLCLQALCKAAFCYSPRSAEGVVCPRAQLNNLKKADTGPDSALLTRMNYSVGLQFQQFVAQRYESRKVRCFRPFRGILWGLWHCRAACVPRRACSRWWRCSDRWLSAIWKPEFQSLLTMGPDPVSKSVFFLLISPTFVIKALPPNILTSCLFQVSYQTEQEALSPSFGCEFKATADLYNWRSQDQCKGQAAAD